MYLLLIVQLDLVTQIYAFNHVWRLQGQSVGYVMLHMEVPNESKLFVLMGLDINHFFYYFGFISIYFNHFDQILGGGFGNV